MMYSTSVHVYCYTAEQMAVQLDQAGKGLVEVEEIHSFVCRCVASAGGAPSHASCLADVLLAADTRGHYSHGLNRLGAWATG